VGGAFAFRTVARQFVGLVPGFGWAIKGGIGATGTIAMGYAAVSYFEGDLDSGSLQARFDKLKVRVKESIRARRAIGDGSGNATGETLASPVAQTALPTADRNVDDIGSAASDG
jgi:hypothetical protein